MQSNFLQLRPAVCVRLASAMQPILCDSSAESRTVIWLEQRKIVVKHNILILGASYGSLFGTKLLLAGHRVTLICTKATADLINREGTLVRFPIKGRESLLDIASKKLPGALSANTPDEIDPGKFDL